MAGSATGEGGDVRCTHLAECGACPLMHLGYDAQRVEKRSRIERALGRYGLNPVGGVEPLDASVGVVAYRRRAMLVVTRGRDGGVSVGLHGRNDHHLVVDVPGCQVLSPRILAFVAELRGLASKPPPALASLVAPHGDELGGALMGVDVRELSGSLADVADETGGLLVTLTLDAASARPVDDLREAARVLRQRLPEVRGVAAQLRVVGRPSPSASDLVLLSGAAELRDVIDPGAAEPTYQLVSHTSFLHVHRDQAGALYGALARLVGDGLGVERARILDLYGGTGAIALVLARAGHHVTMVESQPAAVALATRAAQAQKLPVDVVTGEVASVVKTLAGVRVPFDAVVVNPPRRGISPAAREAIASLGARRIVYVACELDNLSRDLDHLARLGYALRSLQPKDMLPLTGEVEVVAVLERAASRLPVVLFDDGVLFALAKPPHEASVPLVDYPSSLAERACDALDGGAFAPVLTVDPSESGVCLFARTKEQAERFRASLERSGRIVYLAAARGVAPVKGAIARELLGEDGPVAARSRYRRLAIGGGHSVLRVVPERLAPHQVRRHLAAVGHPVLGDMRYGHAPTNRYFEEKHGLDRSFVHLVRVELDHADTGQRVLIEAPLAPDLRVALLRASDESVLRFLDQKQALGGSAARVMSPDEPPPSERASESVYPGAPASHRSGGTTAPMSLRGRNPLDFDEAPRTIRGELVTGDEDEG
ncbi:MAG: methyltransferase [Deltaproteobacteria bacterium]|nr:methyltransferase [Deltaproteobacteria bacterium]